MRSRVSYGLLVAKDKRQRRYLNHSESSSGDLEYPCPCSWQSCQLSDIPPLNQSGMGTERLTIQNLPTSLVAKSILPAQEEMRL